MNKEAMNLDELANFYSTDKGTKYPGQSRHGYAPIYETYLSKWRNNPIRLLEVGVCMEYTTGGHSVMMWYDYFKKAQIFTFDIVDMSNHPMMSLPENRVRFFRGDQGKREDFASMYSTFGNEKFDFILEDGSHMHHHQMISLGSLFKYVASGGYYILEDITERGRRACCIRNDETYDVLQNFKQTGKIDSEHLTQEEKQYIETNTESLDIHIDMQNAYYTAIFTKK